MDGDIVQWDEKYSRGSKFGEKDNAFSLGVLS